MVDNTKDEFKSYCFLYGIYNKSTGIIPQKSYAQSFFQFLAILLFHEICHLQELYPSEAIDDIKGPPPPALSG